MKVPVSGTDSSESDVSASNDAERNVIAFRSATVSGQVIVRASALRSVWFHPITKACIWVISAALGITASWTYLESRHRAADPSHAAGARAASRPDSGTTPNPEGVVPLPSRLDAGSVSGVTSLVDRRAGYELSYPRDWTALTPQVNQAQTISSHLIRINPSSAFSVSSFKLEHAVTSTNLADLRAVTDAILSSPNAKLVVLDVREVKVGGLPAVYYLYYFPDGKQRGIHAHYFIFDGRTMDTLVFQVVPESQFVDYAARFDAVVASFKPLTH